MKLKPIKNKKVDFPIAARQDGKSTLRLNKINEEIKMCKHFNCINNSWNNCLLCIFEGDKMKNPNIKHKPHHTTKARYNKFEL